MKLFLDSAGQKESGFIIAGPRDQALGAMKIEKGCSLLCSGKSNCLVYHTESDSCYLCRTDRSWVSEETLPVSKDWILIYHQLSGVWFGKNELSTCQANQFAALDQIKNYRCAKICLRPLFAGIKPFHSWHTFQNAHCIDYCCRKMRILVG